MRVNIEIPSGLTCPACEERQIETKLVQEMFIYGSEQDRVELRAMIPVHHCLRCGTTFTGEEADEARHDAVCRHLNVLAKGK